MKKRVAMMLCLMPLGLMAQINYNIKGKVGLAGPPSVIYLSYIDDGKIKVDSSTLEKGQYHFQGEVKDQISATLVMNYDGTGIRQADKNRLDKLNIYLENGTIELNSEDSLVHSVFTQGELNQEYLSYAGVAEPITRKQAKIYRRYAEGKKDSTLRDSIEGALRQLEREWAVLNKSYIQSHPDGLMSLVLLKGLEGHYPSYDSLAPMFYSLSERTRNTVAGKAYQEKLDKLKRLSVGAMAPDIEQVDTAGNRISLASFRGKYVLVDFWASWCVPCRAENPNLVKAYQKYRDQNFTMLGVSLDQPGKKQAWIQAIHHDGLVWNHISELNGWKNSAVQAYEIHAIPQNYLVDPHGVIVAKNLRGDELDKKLAEILGKQ